MKIAFLGVSNLSLLVAAVRATSRSDVSVDMAQHDTMAGVGGTDGVVVFGDVAGINFPSDALIASDQNHREVLQCDTVAAFHPNYSLPWNLGKCQFVITCNSPSYTTELECCKAAYAGQTDNYCISQLANPPTPQPTNVGGLDIFYPDYTLAWSEGKCINTTPVPSGRPTYTSMLACCKAAYGGQMSMRASKPFQPHPPALLPS